MNIEEFIKKEAPNENEVGEIHDKAYGKALREAYQVYKDMGVEELKKWQSITRERYDSTHNMVASCMVLYRLIKDLK